MAVVNVDGIGVMVRVRGKTSVGLMYVACCLVAIILMWAYFTTIAQLEEYVNFSCAYWQIGIMVAGTVLIPVMPCLVTRGWMDRLLSAGALPTK